MSDQWHVVYDSATGDACSIGSGPVGFLPSGLAAASITDDQADAILSGDSRWDSATRAVVPIVPPPLPEVTVDQIVVWIAAKGFDPDAAVREAAELA
jgi:hypothetical protein